MKIALGTAQFGLDYGIANEAGQVPEESIVTMLRHAKDAGINTLDTAIAYGDSENRLGKAGVSDWEIISKLPSAPGYPVDTLQWTVEQVRASLKRLNRDTLSAILLHRPHQLLEGNGESLYDALLAIKRTGLVEKIGVSVYSPDDLETLYAHRHYEFDVVQAPLSVMDRRFLNSGWLRRLSDMGVEVHVRSIFLQGLLLMPMHSRPKMFSRWNPLWRDWHNWLKKVDATAVEVCVQYAMSFPEISRVVVGVDSLQQLDDILRAIRSNRHDVPSHIQSDDIELLNPGLWAALA